MENTEGWEIETCSVYMLKGAFISHFLLPFFFFQMITIKIPCFIFWVALEMSWWVRTAKLDPKRLIENVPLKVVQIELPCCHSSRVQ